MASLNLRGSRIVKNEVSKEENGGISTTSGHIYGNVELNNENKRLKEEIEEFKNLLKAKEEENSRLSIQNDNLQEQIRSLKGEREVNHMEFEKLNKRIETLNRTKVDYDRLVKTNNELKKEYRTVQRKVVELKESKKELKENIEVIEKTKESIQKKAVEQLKKDDSKRLTRQLSLTNSELSRVKVLNDQRQMKNRLTINSLKQENKELMERLKKADQQKKKRFGFSSAGESSEEEQSSEEEEDTSNPISLAKGDVKRNARKWRKIREGMKDLSYEMNELKNALSTEQLKFDDELRIKKRKIELLLSGIKGEKVEMTINRNIVLEELALPTSAEENITFIEFPMLLFTENLRFVNHLDALSLIMCLLFYFPLLSLFSFYPPFGVFLLNWLTVYCKVDGCSISKNWKRFFSDEKVKYSALLSFWGFFPGMFYFWCHLNFVLCLCFCYCGKKKKGYDKMVDLNRPLIN